MKMTLTQGDQIEPFCMPLQRHTI